MLDDSPPAPLQTDTGLVGVPLNESQINVDAARYAQFEYMVFDLQTTLEYYSSDISYKKKRQLKFICLHLPPMLSGWREKRDGKYPTKDVYEKLVIPNVVRDLM